MRTRWMHPRIAAVAGVLAVAALAVALAWSPAVAEDAVATASVGSGSKTKEKLPTSAVGKKLDGKLFVVAEDEVSDYKFTSDPEYFIFYHSASW